jgi:hypothetical protein
MYILSITTWNIQSWRLQYLQLSTSVSRQDHPSSKWVFLCYICSMDHTPLIILSFIDNYWTIPCKVLIFCLDWKSKVVATTWYCSMCKSVCMWIIYYFTVNMNIHTFSQKLKFWTNPNCSWTTRWTSSV